MLPGDSESSGARHARVAALVGAGLPVKHIAKLTGLSRSGVYKVIERKVRPNVDGLGEIMHRSRRAHFEEIFAGARKALDSMIASLDGYSVTAGRGMTVKVDCQPQQAAAIFAALWKAIESA